MPVRTKKTNQGADLPDPRKVLWCPQPKQQEMMSRPEYEALYGGAAGGGKSDYLVAEALRQVNNRFYRGIIFRREYPQLVDLIDRSRELYKAAYPRARYNESGHVWKFPSGAKIYFAAMQYEQDRLKYQGRHFDFIGFDELTHFTEKQYTYLFSRARPSGPGTEVYVRATANPGGIGHGWVKSRFVSITTPGTRVVTDVVIHDPKGKEIKLSKDRIFIPSSVFDNPALLENDPGYLASLAIMPEAERNALLYGDWDSFEGQVFTEWKNDPENYETRQWTHVIEPFKIPSGWEIVRGYDFGYAKPFSVGWYAIDYTGTIYRIREYYGCVEGSPNIGTQMEPTEQAQMIRQIEETDVNLKGRKITGIADPSIFDRSRGKSVADMMAKNGVYWSGGDNHRIAGKMQYHYRLAFDENGIPKFYVFNTCKNFIRTIPNLVYDEKNVEDIDTTQEDHIYDECRYVFMQHPIPMRRSVKKEIPLEDPLDLFAEERKKAHRIIRI
nr:MAG TPA: large terminase [Caudoviricetes sp.]